LKYYSFFYFLFVLAYILPAQEIKIDLNKIDFQKAGELDSEELGKVCKSIDFKTKTADEIFLLIKNTSGYDFVDYLIKNERKYEGSTLKWNGDISSIKSPSFKEKILKAKEDCVTFKKKYKNIILIGQIRTKAIGFLNKNNSMLNNIGDVFSYLLPKEVSIFKEHENGKMIDGKSFEDDFNEYFERKQKVFKIKYDLPLQEAINNKKYSTKEILTLMFESEYYLKHYNLSLLENSILGNDSKNTWDDLLATLKLWQDFDSYERYLFEDNTIHSKMKETLTVVLDVISNKNFSEKKEELEKILGAKLYQSIFVEKLDLSKIPELSFDDENTLLKVVGNLR